MLRMLAGAIAFLAMVVPSFWALRSSMIPSASITTNTVDCFRGTIALRATAWLARSVLFGPFEPLSPAASECPGHSLRSAR